MEELEKILREIDRLGNHAIFHLRTGAPPRFLERILNMIISEAGKGIEMVDKTRSGNNLKWVS